jgi:hypothetical protein
MKTKELEKKTDPNHQQLINRKNKKMKIRYENGNSVSKGWKLEGG